MGQLRKLSVAWGVIVLVSAVGCSDDSDNGGGDGDGDPLGAGGFVTNSGGTSTGDGDALDPCFGALVYCSRGCADLTSDEENCGNCGESCGAAEVCEDSMCIDGSEPGMGGEGGFGGVGGSRD